MDNDSCSDEKIPLEPDMGDQRQSTLKALPSPPTTPRRIMNRFRISAICPFALAVVSFVLTIVFLLAGSKPGTFEDEFMVSINATNVGRDLIKFERASSTSAAPTTTTTTTSSSSSSSSSNPLDPLNPFSTSSPLNPNNPNNPLSNLSSIFDPLVGNLTDSVNNGLEGAINEVVETLVKGAGVKDFYYMYLEKVCEGDAANGTTGNNDVDLQKCSGYDDAQSGLNAIAGNIPSSVVIGTTNVSVPLISQLTQSLNTLSTGISALRKAIFAFLIISLIGSGLTALSSLPSIFFAQSRLLVYSNWFWSSLAATFAFLAACILTGLILAIVQTVDGFGDAVSVYIKQGNKALVLVWLGWLFIFLASVYWSAVWFVEVRTWSFVRRGRGEDERGNWKGIGKEVVRDLKGNKSL